MENMLQLTEEKKNFHNLSGVAFIFRRIVNSLKCVSDQSRGSYPVEFQQDAGFAHFEAVLGLGGAVGLHQVLGVDFADLSLARLHVESAFDDFRRRLRVLGAFSVV